MNQPGDVVTVHQKEDSLSCLPTTIFVGPMKCGTSWIHDFLGRRPDVCLNSGTKETFYFDQRFENRTLDWYRHHFEHARGQSYDQIVEVAPTYFDHPEAPNRIRQSVGPISIVVTLRDPVSRAFSLFQHMRRYGMTRETEFREAVNSHPEIIRSSRYAECLRRWESTFGDANVQVLFMEDLVADSFAFAKSVCRCLSVNDLVTADGLPPRMNQATNPRNYHLAKFGRQTGDMLRHFRLYKPIELAKRFGLKAVFFGKPQSIRHSINDNDREWFFEQIRDDVAQLQQRLRRDCSDWVPVGCQQRSQVRR